MIAAFDRWGTRPQGAGTLARSRMPAKSTQLEEAFNGHFNEHHRFLLPRMLSRVDGIGPVAAAIVVAEVGVDMSRFPTAGHLCSWAKFSPGISSSAGKTKGNGSTGRGARYLARVFGEAAGAPTRSWVPDIGASRNAAARNEPSSPSAVPSSSSSGASWPTQAPTSTTSVPITSDVTSTRRDDQLGFRRVRGWRSAGSPTTPRMSRSCRGTVHSWRWRTVRPRPRAESCG